MELLKGFRRTICPTGAGSVDHVRTVAAISGRFPRQKTWDAPACEALQAFQQPIKQTINKATAATNAVYSLGEGANRIAWRRGKGGRRGVGYLDHALELFLDLLLVDEAIYPVLDMIP
jgi:hypothetical protein